MGQFSVTIYGAAGSVLSDIQQSDILNGASPDGVLPAQGPLGEYFIINGDEDGRARSRHGNLLVVVSGNSIDRLPGQFYSVAASANSCRLRH